MTTSVAIRELDERSFAPYGKYVSRPGRTSDISAEDLEYWGGVGTLASRDPMDVGWLQIEPHELVVAKLEHHRHTGELLVALNGDILVPVARNDDERNEPDMDSIGVFRLLAGRGVLIAPGVWHTLPFPEQGRTDCLVVFRQGTVADDFHETVLAEPVAVRDS